MRSGNPVFNEKQFELPKLRMGERRMSLEGTVQKTLILILLLLATFAFAWIQTADGSFTSPLIWIGLFGGLGVGIYTVYNPRSAHITAPIYALLEGLVLGSLSHIFEILYPGIALQAVILTFGVLFAMLILYQTRAIKVTQRFRSFIIGATFGIMLYYLASLLLGFLGVALPFIHDSGPMGIGFSLLVVSIAALNLILDFDFIDRNVEQGSPLYVEWYAAFGLMVTLIWLYLEILRLLSKARD